MRESDAYTNLPPSQQELVGELLDDFDEHWERGQRPRPEDWIARVPPDCQPIFRRELICLELNYRHKELGDWPSPETLVAEHPELRDEYVLLLGYEIGQASRKPVDEPSDPKDIPPDRWLGHRIERNGEHWLVLLEVKGQGAQAHAFGAWDMRLNRQVIVKLSRQVWPDAGTAHCRFLQEAKALAGVRHGNVLTVYDHGVEDGHPFLVTHYVAGANLGSQFQHDRLDSESAAQIVAQIAQGVSVAHRNGVIHRDIKPRNIVLDEQIQPVLIDFGLACLSDAWKSPDDDAPLEVAGTQGYMAPEQLGYGHGQLDQRTDVFGLGGVLYFLATGKAPFPATLHRTNFEADDTPLHESNFPSALIAICLRALNVKPTDRYQSAAEMAEQLQVWLDTLKTELPAVVVTTISRTASGHARRKRGRIATRSKSNREPTTRVLWCLAAAISMIVVAILTNIESPGEAISKKLSKKKNGGSKPSEDVKAEPTKESLVADSNDRIRHEQEIDEHHAEDSNELGWIGHRPRELETISSEKLPSVKERHFEGQLSKGSLFIDGPLDAPKRVIEFRVGDDEERLHRSVELIEGEIAYANVQNDRVAIGTIREVNTYREIGSSHRVRTRHGRQIEPIFVPPYWQRVCFQSVYEDGTKSATFEVKNPMMATGFEASLVPNDVRIQKPEIHVYLQADRVQEQSLNKFIVAPESHPEILLLEKFGVKPIGIFGHSGLFSSTSQTFFFRNEAGEDIGPFEFQFDEKDIRRTYADFNVKSVNAKRRNILLAYRIEGLDVAREFGYRAEWIDENGERITKGRSAGYLESILANDTILQFAADALIVAGRPEPGIWASITGLRLGPTEHDLNIEVPVHIATKDLLKSTVANRHPIFAHPLDEKLTRVYCVIELSDGTETQPFEINMTQVRVQMRP